MILHINVTVQVVSLVNQPLFSNILEKRGWFTRLAGSILIVSLSNVKT